MSFTPSGLLIVLTVLAAAIVFLAVMLERVHQSVLDLRAEYEFSLTPCHDEAANERIDYLMDEQDRCRTETLRAHQRLDAAMRDVVELQHVANLALPNKILTVEAQAAAAQQAVDRLGEAVMRIERLTKKLAPRGRRRNT